MIQAKILADSLAPCGKRLTTMEWTYPRAIHSEIMTHRMLSRNAASSHAIPTERLIERVLNDPWIPSYIGKNQKGMQASEELSDEARNEAQMQWLYARDQAVERAQALVAVGTHKQVVNRLLEPWMWITIIVSASEWNNFFALRDHAMAEPHFQELARAARTAMAESTPAALPAGGWHLPLIQPDERPRIYDGGSCACDGAVDDGCWRCTPERHARPTGLIPLGDAVRIAVGRCARVSYLTHDGRRDIKEDIALHDRLVAQNPPHASAFEHVAQALATPDRCGNLIGWRSYRMTLPNESVPG